MKTLLRKTKFAGIALGLLLTAFVNLNAQTYTAPNLPAVTSDKDDYAPGEIAIIRGTGWTLDQMVDIHLEEEPTHTHIHDYHDTKVNPDGTWEIQYPIQLRHLGVKFKVVVEGQTSKYIGYAYFTDGNLKVDFEGGTSSSDFTFDYSIFLSAADCAGTPSSTGTETRKSVKTFGAGNTDYIQLTAYSTLSTGEVFIGWKVGSTSITHTSQTICLQGVNTGTIDAIAVYVICPTPTITPASPGAICNGSSITLTSSASSGNQWNKDGSAITGATGTTYNATTSGSYTVTVTQFGCPATSAATTVTVRPQFTSGAINTTGETICYGAIPATTIGSTTPASGGDNSITYKWQANGVDIPSSNAATYDPPAGLIATTTYTRFAKDATCNTTFEQSTGSWVVTVRPDFTAGAINTTGETICYNGDPSTIGSTTPASGGDNSITYKWQADGVDIPSSDAATYDPPAGLTATTTYTRFAKDATCNTTFEQSTGSWVVTVRPDFTAGAINTTGETICYNGDPSTIGSTTPASGGDNSITYKWQADGVDIPSSDAATYDPPAGLLTTTTYTRFAKDATCNTTFEQSTGSWVVTVRPDFTAGAINTTGETICYNGDPATIGSMTAASGGDNSITYKWQADGVDIPSSDAATYDPPAGLTATTTYTRFAKDATCNTTFEQSTGSWVVTVRPDFTAGAINTTGETICYNGDPATIGSMTAASGGDNSITYKWQANGVDIPSSDAATYDPPAGLTATTTYTRFAKDATCNTTFEQSTGSWVVTVRPQFTAGAINTTGETICYNGDPATIGSTTPASGGDNSITYKWQADGVDIPSSDAATYDPPAGLTATTTYTRFAKDATCNTTFEQSTGSWVVTVRPDFTAGAINTTGETICYNGDPSTIGSTTPASGGDNSITYKWQADGVDIPSSDAATYDPPAGLTATTTYTRFAKDATCNTTFEQSTGSWVVTVRPDFTAGAINTTGETICYNGDPSTIGSTTPASGGDNSITYKWQADGVDISSSDAATYDPPAGLTATTTYTRFAKDATCNTTFEQSTGTWTVTVRPQFTAGAINTTGETICYNGDPATIGSTTPAGGGDNSITYKWQANGVDIPTSNAATYDPPAGLLATTTYTRFAKDATCNTTFQQSTGTWVVTVNAVTICPTYTGVYFANTTSTTTGGSAVVTLTYNVLGTLPCNDISGLTAGDFTVLKTADNGANVTLVTSTASDPNPTFINGVYTARYTVQLGSGAYSSTVQFTLTSNNSNYTINSGCGDPVLFTVSTKADGFVTGGGFIVPTQSLVLSSNGSNGQKNNFGFNVKSNKSNNKLQGNWNSIIRKQETNGSITLYQVKSSQPNKLVVSKMSATSYRAEMTFTGANFKNLTTGNGYGTGTLTVVVFDDGEPGNGVDRIHMSLKNGATTWYTSSTDGSAQLLTKGNIQIHILGAAATTTSRFATDTAIMAKTTEAKTINTPEITNPRDAIAGLIKGGTTVAEALSIRVLPNPSPDYFTMLLTGGTKQGVTVRVTDVSGKVIEVRNNVTGSAIRLGKSYSRGIYIAEIIQGNARKTFKLIKL